MDSLDSMFMPYEPPPPPAPTSNSYLYLILLLFAFVVIFFFFMRKKAEEPQDELEEYEEKAKPEKVAPEKPPQTQEPAPRTESRTEPIPKNLPEEPIKSEPIPKSAGIAVRDALIQFPLDAQQVADIVRFTVSTLSPPSLQPQKEPAKPEVKKEIPSVEKKVDKPSVEKKVEIPKATSKTHFSVKGLDLPVEEEVIETESAGEKQGKINADTNPLVLQMVKDRK